MQNANIPSKFGVPWAYAASSTYKIAIPTASQIGITNGAASLTDGFVPLNDTPLASGGIPPRIQDMNGIINEVSAWNQWQQAGGFISYDAAFSTAIGGYPVYAIIGSGASPGRYWQSQVDNNTSNPDTDGANWAAVYPFFKNVLVISATGTWTCPVGVTRIKGRAWGGGGAGGNGTVTGSAGAGGGGGAYVEFVTAVTPGTVYTINVGAAGVAVAGATNGTSGGATTIPALSISAGGGGFGGYSAGGGQVAFGAGGIGTGGYLNGLNQSGGTGQVVGGTGYSGYGGSSFGGLGSPSSFGSGGLGALGGGGSGGANGNSGGSGGAGLLILEW